MHRYQDAFEFQCKQNEYLLTPIEISQAPSIAKIVAINISQYNIRNRHNDYQLISILIINLTPRISKI